MKRFLLIFFSLFFISCSKKAPTVESTPVVNPEIEKLGTVLSSLSDRCKNAIPNGNPEEFLSDLKKVLATEKGDLFRLVDKKNYLPEGYVPENLIKLEKNDRFNISRNDLSLRADVYDGLLKLCDGALGDGIKLMVSSTYRSYEYQTKLFNRYVSQDGYENAVRYSAPPGTSQHQMGVAIDFGTIDDSFAETRMGMWLNENAWKYGWSLSFPQGYEDITGYMWECWHFRYIGKEACDFQKKWFSDIQQFMIEFLDAWKKA